MTKKLRSLVAVVATAAGLTVLAPGSAGAAYCGLTWGSADKGAGAAASPLIGVRAGQHSCWDRLVLDVDGKYTGVSVRYVKRVTYDPSGEPVPLRGGAFLQIGLHASMYDQNGKPTYRPANSRELVDVSGYRTFRQAAFAGAFEGETSIGLGVRARLPFRVSVLPGPGTRSRLVIDVAHLW
jgi:hypothetical protein